MMPPQDFASRPLGKIPTGAIKVSCLLKRKYMVKEVKNLYRVLVYFFIYIVKFLDEDVRFSPLSKMCSSLSLLYIIEIVNSAVEISRVSTYCRQHSSSE